MRARQELRDSLITRGVSALREFGYPDCTRDNILTDRVYRALFASTLRDALGHSIAADSVIGALIHECESDDQAKAEVGS